jgi:hypothetical protein
VRLNRFTFDISLLRKWHGRNHRWRKVIVVLLSEDDLVTAIILARCLQFSKNHHLPKWQLRILKRLPLSFHTQGSPNYSFPLHIWHFPSQQATYLGSFNPKQKQSCLAMYHLTCFSDWELSGQRKMLTKVQKNKNKNTDSFFPWKADNWPDWWNYVSLWPIRWDVYWWRHQNEVTIRTCLSVSSISSWIVSKHSEPCTNFFEEGFKGEQGERQTFLWFVWLLVSR